ncbi:hypothetical protein Tco_0199564 [Tanacetum coccineum]
MSAREDDLFELDDDDETRVNGHMSLLPMDNVVSERDSNSFPLFGTSAERASPFAFSANGLSDSKPSASSDPKALESTMLENYTYFMFVAPLIRSTEGNRQNGISTTTTRTPAAIFSTSTPTPWQKLGTSVINDKDLKSNSPFASTPFSTTTTTTGSGLFGSSSLAVTSTTKNQSLASFFNVSNGSQANTQVVVTPSVPFLFGSGTTSIPSSTSGTSPFSSSASTIGTSSSFGISSMTASSHGNYGNFTSGPATIIFGSTWDPVKSSRFGTTYNFGASATPTPSATKSPIVFGASSSRGSTKYSFGPVDPLPAYFGPLGKKSFRFGTTYNDHMSMDSMEEDCMQTQKPVFGMSVDSIMAKDTHVFGTRATTNNYDHMSMDSMEEDYMQTLTPVLTFGQTSMASPLFKFDSATQPPMSSYALHLVGLANRRLFTDHGDELGRLHLPRMVLCNCKSACKRPISALKGKIVNIQENSVAQTRQLQSRKSGPIPALEVCLKITGLEEETFVTEH